MAAADPRALHAALGDIRDQLHLLGLKEALARENVLDDVASMEALKSKLESLERDNAEFFETAIKRRQEAVAPAVMAQLRRPGGLPFRKDTGLHGFRQALLHRANGANEKDEDGRPEDSGDDDYACAAAALEAALEESTVPLVEEEKVLLDSIRRMSSTLAAHEDGRAQQSAHRRAEEQLQRMLAEASSESAAMVTSRHEVAVAESEATMLVDVAQERRLEAMTVSEQARGLLARAALALKRLGRSEWSEIKAMKAPSESLVRMMGAVRLLLADGVDTNALTAASELPTGWAACVQMLSHARFISRLLKLTRGALPVPDVVYVVISRNLREERLEDDDGDVDPLTVDDTPEGVGSRTAHTEHVLRLWLGALLRSRAVKATLEAAKHELAEATEQLHTASSTLRKKATEAKRVQKRMHTLNARISGLIAAAEAVPHRIVLQRLQEYQELRRELRSVEGLHEKLQQEQLEQLSAPWMHGATGDSAAATQWQVAQGGHEQLVGGKHHGAKGGDREASSALAADAATVLESIRDRHRQLADSMRQRLQRLGERDKVQAQVTPRILQAAADNDMATLSRHVHEQEAFAASMAAQPETNEDELWTVLGHRCRDESLRTPLHYACCHGCYEAAMYLLTAGAKVRDDYAQDRDDRGFTALHYATAQNHTRVIVLLHQFDPFLIHAQDSLGQTALHVACQQKQQESGTEEAGAEVVSLLLRIGADPSAVDDTGTQPMGLTAGSEQIRAVLQQALEPVEDAHSVLQSTLQGLEAEFEAADQCFESLLLNMQLGAAVTSNNESTSSSSEDMESSSESEDESTQHSAGSSRHRPRPSSLMSVAQSVGGTSHTVSSLASTGTLSAAEVNQQRRAMAVAFGESRDAKSISPAEQRRRRARADAKAAIKAKRKANRQKKVAEKKRLNMSIFKHVNQASVAASELAARKQARLEQQQKKEAQAREESEAAGELPHSPAESTNARSPAEGNAAHMAGFFVSNDREANGEQGHWLVLPAADAGGRRAASATSDASSALALLQDYGCEARSLRYTDKMLPLRVRYWREKSDGLPGAQLGYARWYRLQMRPVHTPDEVKAQDLGSVTPAERVQLRRVLPPPASQTQRAVKQVILIRRKKGRKKGKQYIPGDLVDDPKRALKLLPVEDNFFGDA